jgi:ribosomal protein S18 acetylase RimI-like enzyme
MDMKKIEYISGGMELLDSIRILWKKLTQHHAEVSTHFSEDIREKRFTDRKDSLIKKSRQGKLRVDLAKSVDQDRYVGYCVTVVNKEKMGEIESIYVEEDFRNAGIGDVLMTKALKWMDTQHVESKIVAVAEGNERAHSFYGRYGFFPRVAILKQKSTTSRLPKMTSTS